MPCGNPRGIFLPEPSAGEFLPFRSGMLYVAMRPPVHSSRGGAQGGNIMTRFGAAAISASIAVAAAGQAFAADATSEIETAQASWEAAFEAGDGAAAAAAVFTEDARLLPPDGPVVEGREAIGKFWQGLMDAGVHSLDLGLIAVEINGDTMIETGTWAVKAPSDQGEVDAAGKALVVWKKGDDGAWRMSQDMWNNGS